MLLEFAFETRRNDPKPLAPFPLIDNGNGWVTWKGNQSNKQLAELQVDYLMGIYGEQTSLLQMTGPARKDFALATKLDLLSTSDGKKTSTVWTQGTECLLPEADFVLFPDFDSLRVPWDRLIEACPENLAFAEAIYPNRWRTNGFPELETVRRIACTE